MTVETKILISLLKLTKEGKPTSEDIINDCRVSSEAANAIFRRYSEEGVLRMKGNMVIVEDDHRVCMAVDAVRLGADLERVCRYLGWGEFEDFSLSAFKDHGFMVKKHFRFKMYNRRWEVDILGFSKPYILSVDCKHWRKGWSKSSIKTMVDSQIKRTEALMQTSRLLRGKLELTEWKNAIFIPVILSLVPAPFKFYKDTPVVPVLQIRNFLNEIIANADSLTHFSTTFDPSINNY